ncbi:MAG: GAF domain-containing protein [Verrucomicrobiae bacterium]|nr:GAF domain-containing protein [Verrucomicrobiae bacterium]
MNRKAQQLEGLFQIAQAILTQPTSGGILDLITRETTLLLNVPVCALFRLQPGGHHLVLESFHGPSTPAPEKIELPVEHSQLGAALVSSKPVWIPEVEKSEPILHAEMARQSGLVSMLAVPLVSGSDTHGLLTVYTQTRHRFANDEIQLLATLGSYSAMAIQRVRFNEQLMELEERLRQNERLSTLGLLAAELSHEIRNPLTVMKMLLHSLAKGVEGEHGRDIQIVMQKMEQLNQTVERVLRLSRAADAELEPLDLNEVVREVLLLTQRQFRQSAIQVFTELSSEPAMIRGDRVQLEQALLNLTLNAAQALEEDRRIYFATSKVDGACELVVRDTGHGIRGDQQKRLFEPFVSDKTGGTGLGLAIVKKIVDHHGGAIRWESSKKGTSFVMSFPASA